MPLMGNGEGEGQQTKVRVERHRKGEEGAGGWIDEEVEHPIASLLLYPLYIIFQGRAHLHLSLSQPILVDVKSRIILHSGMCVAVTAKHNKYNGEQRM